MSIIESGEYLKGLIPFIVIVYLLFSGIRNFNNPLGWQKNSLIVMFLFTFIPFFVFFASGNFIEEPVGFWVFTLISSFILIGIPSLIILVKGGRKYYEEISNKKTDTRTASVINQDKVKIITSFVIVNLVVVFFSIYIFSWAVADFIVFV